jgi:hypothetical protein
VDEVYLGIFYEDKSRQIFSSRPSEFALASAAVRTDVEVATPKAMAISWIVSGYYALTII